MTGVVGPTAPSARGPVALAAGRGAELGALAYLLSGQRDIAAQAVQGALDEVARGQDGDAATVLDRSRLAVVRHALVLAEHLDRSQDDDFWRGGAWALQRLPADQRVLVALQVTSGLDETGLAALLGTPARLVRRRLAAGRSALRRHLRLASTDGDEALTEALRLVAERSAGAVAPVVTAAPAAAAATVAAAAPADLGATDGPVAAPEAESTVPAAQAAPEPAPDDATHLTGPIPLQEDRPRRRAALLVGAARVLAFGVVGVLAWGLLHGGSGDVVVSASPPPSRTPSAAPTSAPAPVTTSSAAITSPPGATATARGATRTRTATRTTRTTRTTARTTARTTRPASRTTAPRTTTSSRPRTTTTSRPAVSRPPSPPAVPAGLLQNPVSGRCVSVPANPPWGTQLRLADCTGGSTQRVGAGAGQTLLLSGLCVDDYGWGTAAGTAVVVWMCFATHPANQQWVVGADGSIRSVHSNLCVDAAGNGRAAGTPLVLNPCDGTRSQVWRRT